MHSEDHEKPTRKLSAPLGYAPAALPREAEPESYDVEPLNEATHHSMPLLGPGEEPPVPASPLHLCPQCQYNLTGLTSRKCPECGQPFTLTQAFRAAQRGPEAIGPADFRVIQRDRRLMRVGLVLVIASVVAPSLMATHRREVLAAYVLIYLPVSLAWTIAANLLSIPRPIILLVCGIIALAVGGVMGTLVRVAGW